MTLAWCRVCLVVSLLLWSAAVSTGVRAQEAESPLPVDPALHIGQLPNGVTYWVRSHATPPGKVTFWMRVSTGSLNEEDGQEGLAHYLEHMAFKGTENFPPGELVTFFESLGLRFGQHQNAFTSFDQTTYTLSLPNTQPETLDKGVLCLADFAFRMRLLADDVEKERGVILEEKRARQGVQQRLTEKLLPELLPGSRAARRLPIGLESSISHFQRDDFVAYYTKWYHPARVTILAVGDAPVESIVAAITKHFAAWQHPTPPPEALASGIEFSTAPRAIVLTDPELTTASVEMVKLQPRTPRLTVAAYRRQLLERLGMWMVNRRMEQRVQEGKAPYQTASTRQGVFFGIAEQLGAAAEAAPAYWSAAFRALLADIRSAQHYGFTAEELAIAQKAALAAAEQAAQTEATQDAQAFLGGMNRAVSVGERPRAAAQNVALLKQLLPGITHEEVSAVFAVHFAPEHRAYIVSLPAKPDIEVPSREALLAIAAEELARPALPWKGQTRPTALLEQEPAPGTIAERTHFAPLGITQVTFHNQARLHYRYMDFKKDEVTVNITLPGGIIRESSAQRGITDMAVLALSSPATSRLSSTDIRDIMTGKKVTVTGRATEDSIVLSVVGTPEGVEEGLRLAHLLLQDAKIEPASVALWTQQKLQEIASARSRIDTRGREAAALALSGDDPRRALLTSEQVQAQAADLPAAQAWLQEILRTAPMEVAIVGDLPEDRAIALAARYLGSLPARARQDPSLQPLRQLPGFTGPLTRTLDVETITPRAHPILMWRCADWQDVRGRRLIFLASRILERRVRQEIREDRALTYSSMVYSMPSKVYPLASALFVEFTTDPEKVAEATAIAKAVVERFAEEGPTDAEMEMLYKQIQNALETMYKEPRFWVDVLGDLEYHGTKLDDLDGALEKFLALTKADIAAEVKKTIVPERFATIVARPKRDAAPEERRSTN